MSSLNGKYQYYKSLLNGKRYSKRLVVLESDDWGSIRMPSIADYGYLKSKNIDVDSNPFNRLDTLEKNSDIEELLGMFEKIKEETGKTVRFTMNFVMANPDFTKIKESDFECYSYQPIKETYLDYHDSLGVLKNVTKGMNSGFFRPQFHAREHVNVDLWMGLLREGNPDFVQAFEAKTFAITSKGIPNIWEAYSYSSDYSRSSIPNSIESGIQLFNSTFGFLSETTIAPVGVWDDNVEKTFRANSIFTFQGFLVQKLNSPEGYEKRYHFNGEKSAEGSTYLVRNAYFEPATSSIDWVNNCMKQIKRAFLFDNPAIISTHRVNYVSRISIDNREWGVKQLKTLLLAIIHKWPDVEFVFSDELV
jgi:hypothetical protein